MAPLQLRRGRAVLSESYRSDELVEVVAAADGSLLELVDHLLNQGVVLTGDVLLGLADVDLIYLRLSVLICAADRILPRRERGER